MTVLSSYDAEYTHVQKRGFAMGLLAKTFDRNSAAFFATLLYRLCVPLLYYCLVYGSHVYRRKRSHSDNYLNPGFCLGGLVLYSIRLLAVLRKSLRSPTLQHILHPFS